jgi:hypothetical protein
MPSSRKQNGVQSHIYATKQGYATQSEAKPKTPNPHTGLLLGQSSQLLNQQQNCVLLATVAIACTPGAYYILFTRRSVPVGCSQTLNQGSTAPGAICSRHAY